MTRRFLTFAAALALLSLLAACIGVRSCKGIKAVSTSPPPPVTEGIQALLPSATLPNHITAAPSTATCTPAPTIRPTITPTARIFEGIAVCGKPNDNGHIFFLRSNDLMVMNGNGCFPRKVLDEASGSPGWSKDWTRLAVGCEDDSALCILDVQATLATCTIGGLYSEGQCSPVVLEKFALPREVAGQNSLRNITWSPDHSRIIVTGRKSAHTLSLKSGGTWEVLFAERWGIEVDWSPKESELIIAGSKLVDLSTGEETQLYEFGGWPQWSPDGKLIAFQKYQEDETREPYGVAVIEVATWEWRWLYEPLPRDKHYWPPQNLLIRGANDVHRLISWSPDQRYLAVALLYRHSNDTQIFRLDTITGDIVPLTVDLGDSYWAPAWGP